VELGLAARLLAENAAGMGYLLKDRITDLDEFAAAIRRLGAGGSALDPASPNCWAGAGTTMCSNTSLFASARCWP
jgi:hypothetical protein